MNERDPASYWTVKVLDKVGDLFLIERVPSKHHDCMVNWCPADMFLVLDAEEIAAGMVDPVVGRTGEVAISIYWAESNDWL